MNYEWKKLNTTDYGKVKNISDEEKTKMSWIQLLGFALTWRETSASA